MSTKKIALVWTATGSIVKVQADRGRIEVEGPDGLSVISPAKPGWERWGWRIYDVRDFELPDGKVTVGAPSYALDGDVVAETYVVEDEPLPPLNNWRFHWMIERLGWDATIRATIDAIEDEEARSVVLFRYLKASEFNRNDAALNMVAQMMGLSPAQLDAAWKTAAAVAV